MNASHQIWYVRHGDAVTGPFPPHVITDFLLLGRISPDDQVSPDKVNWLPLRDFPELMPKVTAPDENADPETRAWQEERVRASLRWAEERLSPEPPQVSGGERRHAGQSFEELAFREHHAEVQHSLEKKPLRAGWAIAVLVAFALATAVSTLVFRPVNPVKIGLPNPAPDCRQTAGPDVNWSGCDKQGMLLTGVELTSANLGQTRFNGAQLDDANLSYAKLQGADFSFANLANARLISADLQNADLSQADLTHADLRYADLRGAKLDEATLQGTLFDHATWLDGRVCATGSIGRCL
jgi:uncharacterized protein YjbI with pentapeptide repeats